MEDRDENREHPCRRSPDADADAPRPSSHESVAQAFQFSNHPAFAAAAVSRAPTSSHATANFFTNTDERILTSVRGSGGQRRDHEGQELTTTNLAYSTANAALFFATMATPPTTTNGNGASTALPENDGMQSLRLQLQEIKQLAVSTEEKAKRMHRLMTQDYMKHRALLEPSSPAANTKENGAADTSASVSPVLGPVDPENPYELRPGDLDVVISPLPKNPTDVEGELDEAIDDDEPELGCMHYKRNVKVQCYDCHRWFPCRHCHDQARDLPFPHTLNRKKTRNMLCMLCQTPQPAAEICANCGEYAAWYYCPKCKLWDNDSNKRIYHCDDCGICRVGEGLGKDYVHCRRCNVCISISTSAAHPCIERATEGNCPLCLIPLFESRMPVVSLPCGHYMHGDCYKDLMAVTYKCPVCSKSAVNMELQWKKLDDEIEAQPMPEDEDLEGVLPHVEGHEEVEDEREPQQRRPRQVWIGCNDCGGRSWTDFHWLGLKCWRCDSYNTNQMAPTAVHETETERLMRQQQIHRHDFTGDAVLRDAGIGVTAPEEQFANSALEVPESPSQQARLTPTSPRSSPRLPSGAQSPGRYFVNNEEEIRRPSFSRFSAPSMPNLPTLSDMPRIPRLPNLPNFRQNLPNMPNVELPLPRFSPYEMIDSLSRSLSPMRYYLRGLDREDLNDEEVEEELRRPTSVRSEPPGIPGGKWDGGLWDGEESAEEGESSDEEEEDDDDDDEAVEEEDEDEKRGDLEIFGHR